MTEICAGLLHLANISSVFILQNMEKAAKGYSSMVRHTGIRLESSFKGCLTHNEQIEARFHSIPKLSAMNTAKIHHIFLLFFSHLEL